MKRDDPGKLLQVLSEHHHMTAGIMLLQIGLGTLAAYGFALVSTPDGTLPSSSFWAQ